MKYLATILFLTLLSFTSHAQQLDSVSIRIRTILKEMKRPYNQFMVPGDDKKSDSSVMINVFFSKDSILNQTAYIKKFCDSLAAKIFREGLKDRAMKYNYITFWCRFNGMVDPLVYMYAIKEPPKGYERPENFFYMRDIVRKY